MSKALLFLLLLLFSCLCPAQASDLKISNELLFVEGSRDNRSMLLVKINRAFRRLAFILSSALALSLLFTRCLMAQPGLPPAGAFRLDDGAFAVLARMDGNPALIFPDGNIRGLRPANTHGIFEFGNAIGLFDQIEGQVEIGKNGSSIRLKTATGLRTGTKVELNVKAMKLKSGGLKLSGELILPEGKGPFPCVVMTHGSGPESREGNRALALLFAGNGIASFIYDKRGIEKADVGDWQESFDNYAADAVAAAKLVNKHQSIDPSRVGIFGHSQGGWVAPLAASQSDLFSFVIISAGNAVSPVEQHLYNGICANRQNGVPERAIREIYDFRVIKYEAGITGDSSKYKTALPVAEAKPWFVRTGPSLPTGRFWKFNGYYDPEPALSALKCPVLVIAGELDRYSDTQRNMALFKAIFEKSGNTNVTFKVFPSTNHALLHTPTGKLDETEFMELKKFADGYFETLTGWVKEVVKA